VAVLLADVDGQAQQRNSYPEQYKPKIEKMPLKRAAQSFSFRVPTKEFINRPVQTLFQGTVLEESSDASSSRHRPGNRAIKSFSDCEYNNLS